MKKATLAKINGTEPAPWIKMTSQQTELDQPMPVSATIGPTLTLTLALASKVPWSVATDYKRLVTYTPPIHTRPSPPPPPLSRACRPALAGTEATSPLAALQPLSPMPPPPSPAP